MNKKGKKLFWMFVVIIFILNIMRHSGRLFSLSTYKETFIVLAGGFLLIGFIMWVFRCFI